MPNSKEHFTAGLAVGTIGGGIMNIIRQCIECQANPQRQFNFWELIGAIGLNGATCAIGSTVPDLLEPAIHPRHRKICHSYSAIILESGAIILVQNSKLPYFAKDAITFFGAGLLSHQVEDEKTPAGLPLI